MSAAADWTAEGDQASANFGFSVGTAGDVNGDGYSDVIIGAYNYDNGETNEGRAFVYQGSAAGLSATADWTVESDQAGARFGYSVGTAGDVNGDGYSDVIVGAFAYDTGESDEGWAFVYHGSATGLSVTADWTAESDQASARFGYSVGTAGDVNGDGFWDVIVGALYYDNGEDSEGRALVYQGSATGLSATSDWTAESDQASALFGYSVGTAGDVNGDGYSDVIVGAIYYDNGETDVGGAFVYHGVAPPSPDLSIAKTDSPDPVIAGKSVTYTLTFTNNGPSDATGVTVTDTLPVGTTFISVTPAQGSCSGTSTITCSLSGLASNASTTVTIQVTVNSSTTGTITNTASVTSSEADPIATNNTTTSTTTVIAEADVSITKSDAPDTVIPGTSLSYIIVVTNEGPSDATAIGLNDSLPPGMAFDSDAHPHRALVSNRVEQSPAISVTCPAARARP